MATATKTNLRTIALADIKVADGFNPRKEFDTPEDADLAANIKQHGILLPLLVTEDPDDGKFWLVDGERRYRAAKKARVTEIPVHVGDKDAPVDTLALIANIQRRDLNPIEKATQIVKLLEAGTTQKDLAKTLNVAPSNITEHKRLLDLPPLAREAIATGALPVASSRFLLDLTKVSAAAADQAAIILQGENMAPHRTHPERVAHLIFDVIADNVHNDLGEDIPKVTAAYDAMRALNPDRDPQPFVWPEDSEAVQKEWAELPDYTYIHLTDADIDAGRAHGSVFEIERDNNRDIVLFLDAEFLVDRIKLALENRKKAAEEEAEETPRGTTGTPAANAGGKDAAVTPEVSEHQLREQARAAAHLRNTEIGRNSFKLLAEVKPTLANIRALILAVLYKNTDLPGAGIALTDERIQTVETSKLKNGATKTKITYPDKSESEARLIARINSAKTVEELLGIFWSAVVAGIEADSEATLVSDRRYWGSSPFHGVYNDDYRPVQDEAAKLVLKVLPKAEADARRAKAKEQREKKAAAEKKAAEAKKATAAKK